MEIAQQWMEQHHLFFVLSADNGVDTFFWMTAFLASYKMLSSAHQNINEFPISKCRMILDRAVRLLPLYVFTLLFFWRIMVLFGGDGPLFFNYERNHDCSESWMLHVLFVNNIFPWR
jgi:peptidoglycan/LPS O-acetylase OafA/YrhL